MRLSLLTMGAVVFCLTTGFCFAQTRNEASSLCSLRGKVAEGTHVSVRVSGTYSQDAENRTLTDSACATQYTWIEFKLKTTENEIALQNSLGSSRQARVVFEGDFYGPPKPDPKLPDALRKAVQPSWGPLSCCETRLVVYRIREVVTPKPVAEKEPYRYNEGSSER
jgi:hypothetical protein